MLLDVMMWAQLRGYGAGVSEIAGGAVAKSGAAGMIEVGLETKLSAKVDGHQSNGMLVLHKAVGIAVEKAKAHGMALVGTANMSSSAGALGYYLETIAQQGLVGLVLAQSPQMVAPFCQNPIGVAVPSARGPVVVDLASAAHTLFGLAKADAPAVSALEGAIATFDKGYQGSQLSLMCELLANPILEAPDHAVRRAPAARPRSALPPPSPPSSLATTASHLPRPTSHLPPLAGPPRPRLRPRAARREGQVPPDVENAAVPMAGGLSPTVDAALKLASVAIDDAAVTALRQKAGGMPTPAAAAAPRRRAGRCRAGRHPVHRLRSPPPPPVAPSGGAGGGGGTVAGDDAVPPAEGDVRPVLGVVAAAVPDGDVRAVVGDDLGEYDYRAGQPDAVAARKDDG